MVVDFKMTVLQMNAVSVFYFNQVSPSPIGSNLYHLRPYPASPIIYLAATWLKAGVLRFYYSILLSLIRAPRTDFFSLVVR
jgi:hypothetical protein